MTRERPRARKRVEKWREGRLAVRALRVCTVLVACGGQRGVRPVPVEGGKVLFLKDVVEPPRFSEERVRLRDWSLLVRVAVHLEGRLRFTRKSRRWKKEI